MGMDKNAVENLLSGGDEPLRLLDLATSQGCTLQHLASTWRCGATTLLMLAAKYGRTKCCELLVNEKPSTLNVINGRKYNALHFSSFGGNEETSLFLLRAGCNPLAVNKYGETCSDAARSGGYIDLARTIKMEMLRPRCVTVPVSHGVAAVTTAPICSAENIQLVRRRVGIIGQSRWMTSATQECCYGAVCVASTDSTVAMCSYQRAQSRKTVLQVITVGDGADQCLLGCTFDLSGSEVKDIFIGRGSANDFKLRDLSVSKQHAVLSYHAGLGYAVRDLGSVHGTYINDVQVQPHHRFSTDPIFNLELYNTEAYHILGPDDVLKLGRLTLRIRDQNVPTILSSRFIPNSEFGKQLLNQVETRHIIERAAKKGRDVAQTGVAAAEKRKFNRLALDQAVTYISNIPSMTENSTTYLEEKLQEREVGASLLQKMGWRPGRGLGRTESGMADFIHVSARAARTGIGIETVPYYSVSSSMVEEELNASYCKRYKICKITASRYAASDATTNETCLK